jgi:hypothetical protein
VSRRMGRSRLPYMRSSAESSAARMQRAALVVGCAPARYPSPGSRTPCISAAAAHHIVLRLGARDAFPAMIRTCSVNCGGEGLRSTISTCDACYGVHGGRWRRSTFLSRAVVRRCSTVRSDGCSTVRSDDGRPVRPPASRSRLAVRQQLPAHGNGQVRSSGSNEVFSATFS